MAFNKINKGQPDWHIPLNENFERIENGEGLPKNLQKLDSKGYLSIYPNPNESNILYKDLATIQFGVNENVTDFSTSIIGDRNENKASITMRAGTDDRNFKQLVLNSLAASDRIDFASVTNGIVKYGKVHNSLDFPVESGTWTPSFEKGTFTYGTQYGYYYLFGKMVYITFGLKINSMSNVAPTERVAIVGPPFNPLGESSRQVNFSIAGWSNGFQNVPGNVSLRMAYSNIIECMVDAGKNVATAGVLTYGSLTTNTNIEASGLYRIA